MSWQRKAHGGLLGFVGFMLSPLSWWNDAFVNLPLALAFAWIISLFYRPAFEVALIIGYWLTNIIGLVLLHQGARVLISKDGPKLYSRRDLLRDLAISLLYTGLIVMLIKLKILQPIGDYFARK